MWRVRCPENGTTAAHFVGPKFKAKKNADEMAKELNLKYPELRHVTVEEKCK